MKLPRLTIFRLLVTVAVLALATGVVALLIQAGHRRERAAYHSRMEAETQKLMTYYKGDMVLLRGTAREKFPEMLARFTKRNAFHAEMKRKWEEAARRPWLSVEPDPPEPE